MPHDPTGAKEGVVEPRRCQISSFCLCPIRRNGFSIEDNLSLLAKPHNGINSLVLRDFSSQDIVDPGRVITDGETLISAANRETPLRDASGALNLTIHGVLVLVNSSNGVCWSSNTSRSARDPVAQLLDSGNLVVRQRKDEDQRNYLWQGFDYPCDTMLPGMRIGKDLRTGFESYVSVWTSTEDPSPGSFSMHMDARGYPQLVIKKGNEVQYRPGSWNGRTWTGSPNLVSNPLVYMIVFEFNENEVSFTFEVPDGSALTRETITQLGMMIRSVWNEQLHDWKILYSSTSYACENYALCGAFSRCTDASSTVCSCLYGFVPKNPGNWSSGDWSGGCVRRTPLDCDHRNGFLNQGKVRLPDTSSSTWTNSSRSLKECEELCLNNCSCTGYAYLDIRGSGCLFWHDELIDIRTLDEGGQELFVRLAVSELDKLDQKGLSDEQKKAAIIAGSIIAVCVVLTLVVWLIRFQRRKSIREAALAQIVGDIRDEAELPIFHLNSIADATDNFSNSNKLGQGGFGPVYKGTLANGQEIAVKRLSKSSGQGLTEFKTEVKLIAKLQHRNLVRLLGCCIHEDEKMLVYEFMASKSLDFYIFDKERSKMLDWSQRRNIIEGIARGLQYLHQDSRLRIIHRDLKASNILLDSNMNSKISDFGLARTFGADQTEANTKRVVGTYGYMAPEYVVDGIYSMKSDVFSFGVIVLEIVSGEKNRGYYHTDHDLNLLGHAWMLWTKGTPLQLLDECLAESCEPSEVTRYIHIALLCVQQRPENRPTMGTVVMMLSGEGFLPMPNQPGYFMARSPHQPDSSISYSENEVTISMLNPR